MRTFLREETEHKALQIQAIGLSLYEPVEGMVRFGPLERCSH